MKKKLISLVLILVFSLSPIQAQAATNDWMALELSDYEPFQEILRDHPDATIVQSNTSYVLTETIKNDNGDIVSLKAIKFSSLANMNNYQRVARDQELVIPNTISPGNTYYVTYSKMQVGLQFLRYSTGSGYEYFVACLYNWLTPPDMNVLEQTVGVVGLALDTGLVMNGGSYDSRMTYVRSGQTYREYPSVMATGTQGIGYCFNIVNDVIYNVTSMSGVISCTAKKSFPSAELVSAYGEYAAVNYTLDLTSFSVSLSGGISFRLATSKTPYSVQDNLDVRN